MYPYTNSNYEKNISAAEEEILMPQEDTSRFAQLIVEGITDEEIDSANYKSMADEEEDSETIELYESMADDESRHSTLLRQMYKDLTGVEAPQNIMPAKTAKLSKPQQLKQNIINEIDGARFYRDLAAVSQNDMFTQTIYSILNDEQNHAVLNQYILNDYIEKAHSTQMNNSNK